MAHRSQCSSAGDNPLDPNYLPPHYREEYRLAIDALVERDLDGYNEFLQSSDVVDFLSKLEIEHIQSAVQGPRHMDKTDAGSQGDESSEGSSDTYWPMQSDLEAPSLDLGWPQQLQFVGPTEFATFVNPPDAAMPSIKTQARRLIKDAQLVIAVAMDIFTDVDIFADLLEAAMRNVAVYILLDDQNAHHFTDMVAHCRVDLNQIKFMRVRTVSGINYYCRTGKSFKGQMMERFMLIDSRAVLGGNYSFMWSFEKLHRCLAHLFLGQLVVTFDEEFRILYAQSEPLVMESAVVPVQNFSSMSDLQKTHQVYPRKPKEYLPEVGMYNADWPGHLNEGHMDSKLFPFRRGDFAQMLPPQANLHPSQQYLTNRPDAPGMDILRRASYGEGTPSGYYQQYLMHREKQKGDAMETQSTHSHRDQYDFERTSREPVYDPYDKFKTQRYPHPDQYSEPGGPPSIDQVDNYDHVLKFLQQSNPPVDMGQGSGNLMVPEGPYSQSRRRMQCLGQPHAGQSSPAPLSPREQKRFNMEPPAERKPRDAVAKKGMREWRIHSYLSGYDDASSDDTGPFQGSEVGDESPFSPQEQPCDLDPLFPRIGQRELKLPSAVLSSHHKKPFQPSDLKNHPSMQIDNKSISAATDSAYTTETEKVEDGKDKPPAEMNVTQDEPFRRKPNQTLHRASRLRNSLLFSSNTEQHRSLFDLAKPAETKEEASLEVIEKGLEKIPLQKQSTIAMGEELKPVELPLSHLQQTPSFMVDMNDPDNRLHFFRQLAAQRKAEVAAKSVGGITEKPCKVPDITVSCASDGSHSVAEQEPTLKVSHHPTDMQNTTESQSFKATTSKVPIKEQGSDTKLVDALSVTSEAATPSQIHDVLPQMATDAEKIEQKRLQEPAVAKCTSSLHPGSNISSSEPQKVMETLKENTLDSAPEPGRRELPVMPSAIISESPPNRKPVQPVMCGAPDSEKTTPAETTDFSSTTSSEKAAAVASVRAMDSCKTGEELVQNRPKPTPQSASKLRNSRLFSSRLKQHRSQGDDDSCGQNKTDGQNQRGELSKVSSILAVPGSLDKETSRSETPITPTNPTTELVKTQDSTKGQSDTASGIHLENMSFKRQASFTMGDTSNSLQFQSKVQQATSAMLDLSDPDSRLHFFRELAAQRKAERVAAKPAENIKEHISQKPDKTEDSSAINEKVSAQEQIRTDSLSKPIPAGDAEVLDDDAKTRKTQSVPESHAVKDLSGNSAQSSSSSSEFSQTATDTEKMELKKMHTEAPAKPPCTSSTSSVPTNIRLPLKDIPKEVILSCQDQASRKQTSASEEVDLPNKPVPADSTLPSLPINAGQSAHSPISHPAKSIPTAEDSQGDSCSNPSSKQIDSDSSSCSSLIEVSSGAEGFATAPSSPCTPTPTEVRPLPLPKKESKCTEPILPPLSPSIKTRSPQRSSSKEDRSKVKKGTSARQVSPTSPSTLLISSPANSSSATGAVSTEHHLAPVSSPTKSPVDLHLHPPVEVNDASGTVITQPSPPPQTALTSPDVNTVVSPTKTDSSLASFSSPTKTDSSLDSLSSPTKTDSSLDSLSSPTKTQCKRKTKPSPTATVSQTESRPPQAKDGIPPATTPTTPVASTRTTPKTARKRRKNSSPLKATQVAMVPPTELRSPVDIKIIKISSDSATVKTEEHQSPVSSPTNTNPMANVAPTEYSSSTEAKIAETSPILNQTPVVEVVTEGSGSSYDPETSEASPAPNLIQSKGCSSTKAISTSPKETVPLTASSSHFPSDINASETSPSVSPVLHVGILSPSSVVSPAVGTLDSPVHPSSHPTSSPTSTSPMLEATQTKLNSPCDVKTLDSSLLSDLKQTGSSLPPTATTPSAPLANHMATASRVPTSPGPTPPAPTDPPSAEASPSPVVTVSGGGSNSDLTLADAALPTDESSRSFTPANTTSSFNEAVNGGQLESDAKAVGGYHPSADTATLSPADELSTTTHLNTKDTVTPPSSEEPNEHKSPSAKSHPSRYQASTANVLSCSNLRDDTKVLLEQISANSQSRTGNQNLSITDDDKEDEVKEPQEESNETLPSRLRSWNTHMSKTERDRLLTGLDSKRKERRVYSRFEAL